MANKTVAAQCLNLSPMVDIISNILHKLFERFGGLANPKGLLQNESVVRKHQANLLVIVSHDCIKNKIKRKPQKGTLSSLVMPPWLTVRS